VALIISLLTILPLPQEKDHLHHHPTVVTSLQNRAKDLPLHHLHHRTAKISLTMDQPMTTMGDHHMKGITDHQVMTDPMMGLTVGQVTKNPNSITHHHTNPASSPKLHSISLMALLALLDPHVTVEHSMDLDLVTTDSVKPSTSSSSS
jgi:hypothetical protein